MGGGARGERVEEARVEPGEQLRGDRGAYRKTNVRTMSKTNVRTMKTVAADMAAVEQRASVGVAGARGPAAWAPRRVQRGGAPRFAALHTAMAQSRAEYTGRRSKARCCRRVRTPCLGAQKLGAPRG